MECPKQRKNKFSLIVKKKKSIKFDVFKRNMKKNNEVGGFTQPDCNISYKATVIKLMECCHEDRCTDERNRTLEINPCVYGQSTDFQQRYQGSPTKKGQSSQQVVLE